MEGEDVYNGNCFKQNNSSVYWEKVPVTMEPYNVITLPAPAQVNTELLENLDKQHKLDK